MLVDKTKVRGLEKLISEERFTGTKLKGFIRGFKGVSTKYLNNYLTWNNCVNSSMDDKVNTLLRTALSALATVKCRDLAECSAVPLIK